MAELHFFTGTMDSGKSTLALQTNHNHAARGRVGRIFTTHDRAGQAVLSSRLGLTHDALEVDADFDFWSYVVDTLTRLRLKGFSLSVDDFGTGYSSLAQLARLPLSEIKIDRSFVMRLLDSDDARKIVDATIRLAKGMDLVSVAEGVEDAAVQDAVAQLGCTLAQGYHISRPLPVDDFDAWLQARH